MPGSIVSYCSCRNPDTGKRWPQGRCPKWAQRGHKRWGWTIDLPKVWDEDTGRWRRQQARRMGYPTRRDAEQALAHEVPAIAAGTAPTLADRQTTLGEFLDHWLRDPRWRPTTATAYQRDVRLYIRPGLGHLRLTDVRPEHIAALLDRIRDGRLRPPGRGGPAPAALRSVHTTLRAALNVAVRERRLTWNPCTAVRVETPPRPAVQVWEPSHIAAFLNHVRQAAPDLAPAYQVAAWRGLRRGELLALRWADLDLDAGTARIERNVTETNGGQLHIGQPKTERGKRTVSLGPKLVTVLRAHRRAQAERRLAAESWEDHDLVFPGPDGRLLPPHRLTYQFRALASQVPGLPDLHLHGLRHSAATAMLVAGVPPKVVQDQLGHATLAMTMDLYGHVIAAQRDASADAVERLYSTDVTPL